MKVAGLGFRKDAPTTALEAALALAEAKGGAVTALATLPAKADAPQIVELAQARGLPVLAVEVKGVATLSQSPRIAALHGTGSLAEAAALVGAGPGARLVVARVVAPDGSATAAIAEIMGELE